MGGWPDKGTFIHRDGMAESAENRDYLSIHWASKKDIIRKKTMGFDFETFVLLLCLVKTMIGAPWDDVCMVFHLNMGHHHH